MKSIDDRSKTLVVPIYFDAQTLSFTVAGCPSAATIDEVAALLVGFGDMRLSNHKYDDLQKAAAAGGDSPTMDIALCLVAPPLWRDYVVQNCPTFETRSSIHGMLLEHLKDEHLPKGGKLRYDYAELVDRASARWHAEREK